MSSPFSYLLQKEGRYKDTPLEGCLFPAILPLPTPPRINTLNNGGGEQGKKVKIRALLSMCVFPGPVARTCEMPPLRLDSTYFLLIISFPCSSTYSLIGRFGDGILFLCKMRFFFFFKKKSIKKIKMSGKSFNVVVAFIV